VIQGARLFLMAGPLIPIPAPRAVVEALAGVTVTNSDSGRSGFELTFNLSTKSPLHTIFLLSGGGSVEILRIVLAIILNGTPHVLIDGVVSEHSTSTGEHGRAVLTLRGEDISLLMDKQDLSGFPFPAMPAEGRIAVLLAKYAALGIVPVIIPSVMVDVPLPMERIPSQRGTDLSYIRDLADEVGYVFYIESGPLPGMNVAYWGPRIKVGLPQPSLNVDADAHTNVLSLKFAFDNDKNAIPTLFYYDERTRVVIPIPLPPITPLSPPLGLIPPIPTRLKPVGDTLAKQSLAKGILIGLAKAAEWAEALTAEGEINVVRYGRILKARQLVTVRGAGPAFDGLHYVKKVTHRIKAGEYRQSFELSRNGLLSTLPRIPQ
jgi:hypothetical protein